MKSLRFAKILLVLSVCTFVFLSAPAESSWLDKVKHSAKDLQETGEEAIKLKKTGKALWKGDKGTPTAPKAGKSTPTATQTGKETPSATQTDKETPAATKVAFSDDVLATLDLDIDGVKLGMTVSEAKAILERKYPGRVRLDGNIIIYLDGGSLNVNFGGQLGTVKSIFRQAKYLTLASLEKNGKPTFSFDYEMMNMQYSFYEWSVYPGGERAENESCDAKEIRDLIAQPDFLFKNKKPSYITAPNRKCAIVLSHTINRYKKIIVSKLKNPYKK